MKFTKGSSWCFYSLSHGVLWCAVLISTSAYAQDDIAPTKGFFQGPAAGDTVVVLEKPLVTRNYGGKNTVISVAYDPCFITDVKFEESERRTRIQSDLLLLGKKLPNHDRKACLPLQIQYTTIFDRSLVIVKGTNAKGELVANETIVMGKQERLSLGLDLPISNRKTAKYDAATKSLLPTDDSPQLFLSLNITGGDVWVEPHKGQDWYENLELKLMVAASSRPLNSYGVGVGYKFAPLKTINLDGLSIFVGYFRTKEDGIANGTPLVDQGRKNSVRVGLSYDLSTALKWAKF